MYHFFTAAEPSAHNTRVQFIDESDNNDVIAIPPPPKIVEEIHLGKMLTISPLIE